MTTSPCRAPSAAPSAEARPSPAGPSSRAALVARGVVYGIVGILALKLAVGAGGKSTNQRGALETIAHQPFGKALLVVMVSRLAGYATWRLVRAGTIEVSHRSPLAGRNRVTGRPAVLDGLHRRYGRLTRGVTWLRGGHGVSSAHRETAGSTT